MAIHIAESEQEQALIASGTGSFADGLRRRVHCRSRRIWKRPCDCHASLGVLDVSPLLILFVRCRRRR